MHGGRAADYYQQSCAHLLPFADYAPEHWHEKRLFVATKRRNGAIRAQRSNRSAAGLSRRLLVELWHCAA
jgi:hypothetical protein